MGQLWVSWSRRGTAVVSPSRCVSGWAWNLLGVGLRCEPWVISILRPGLQSQQPQTHKEELMLPRPTSGRVLLLPLSTGQSKSQGEDHYQWVGDMSSASKRPRQACGCGLPLWGGLWLILSLSQKRTPGPPLPHKTWKNFDSSFYLNSFLMSPKWFFSVYIFLKGMVDKFFRREVYVIL